MAQVIKARYRLRSGTTAQWAANDEVLGAGEVGEEVTTDGRRLRKTGNGTDAFSVLPYRINYAVDESVTPTDKQALRYDITTGKWKPQDDPAGGGSGSGALTGINEQTGTTYTLVLADATKGVRMTNAAACTLTIPASADVALPLYVALPIFQGGAGVVSIAAATGVTAEAASGAATIGVGDFRTIFQRATNIWVIG